MGSFEHLKEVFSGEGGALIGPVEGLHPVKVTCELSPQSGDDAAYFISAVDKGGQSTLVGSVPAGLSGITTRLEVLKNVLVDYFGGASKAETSFQRQVGVRSIDRGFSVPVGHGCCV
ncbi:MAG TPA: hypothetical protein PKI93_05200 [Alphaproteobacteria bacterium]|nr:hypothetical protein [Alphaproteobacteria bacterium]HNS45002.1 hypothetical protein [Alphaproteobacteria bacterium]